VIAIEGRTAVKPPNPEDCRKSAERCRREALAKAGSNEWVRISQAWEAVAAMSERLMAAQAGRGWGDPGARPRAMIT
jgi:hypothetical protein